MDETYQPSVGDRVLAKLDDAPWREATVRSIQPWGRGVRYNCEFASGWVLGTCRVRPIDTESV